MAPACTRGTIAVPVEQGSVVRVDGRVVRPRVADGYARVDARGGTSTVTVRQR